MAAHAAATARLVCRGFHTDTRRSVLAGMAIALSLGSVARADDDPVLRIEFKDGVVTPLRLEVLANRRFSLELYNLGEMPAEFESRELRKEKVLAPGTNSVLVIRRQDPGQYDFFDDFHPDAPSAVCVAGTTLALGRWSTRRLHHLTQALIPIAGCGVFLGLSTLTVTMLRGEGFALDFVNPLRACLLVGAGVWSLSLGWQLSAYYAKSMVRRLIAMVPFGVAIAAGCASWASLYWAF